MQVSAAEHASAAAQDSRPYSARQSSDLAVAVLIAAAFFLLLSATPSIPGGYDSYRHVRLARLLTENPTAVFRDPWHLAYLWTKPVDAWFGYHVILAPLTRVFDLVLAAKVISTLIFGAIAFVLLRLLDLLSVQQRWFWLAVTLAGSSITLNRSATCRPFLFSILLILTAALFTLRSKPVAVAVVAALHAVAYSIFFLVAMVPGVWLLLRRNRPALRTAVACAIGIAIGLLLNPYFPENVRFDVVQSIITKIAVKAHVEIGRELDPIQPGWWFLLSSPVVTLWLAAIVTRIRRRRERQFEPATDVFLLLSAAALAGSFQVGRTYDLFVPFATVFSAAVLSPLFARNRRDAQLVIAGILVVCASHVFLAYRTARQAVNIYAYRSVSEYLRTHTAGQLVTNAEWGEYHYLFFWNPESRYVIGFEPTFLYLTDARKYWTWRHMSNDEPSTCTQEVCPDSERTDIAAAVLKELKSRYVVVNRHWNPRLAANLKSRAGVSEVYRDTMESVFRINF
jgi:hypothetical protein